MNKYETWDKLKEPAPEIDSDGTKRWTNDYGEIHRLAGPAIMYASGLNWWYLNGKSLSEKEFNELTK